MDLGPFWKRNARRELIFPLDSGQKPGGLTPDSFDRSEIYGGNPSSLTLSASAFVRRPLKGPRTGSGPAPESLGRRDPSCGEKIGGGGVFGFKKSATCAEKERAVHFREGRSQHAVLIVVSKILISYIPCLVFYINSLNIYVNVIKDILTGLPYSSFG